MDNQHKKISGYRDLSQEEIDLMNRIKALGPIIEEVINDLENIHWNSISNSSVEDTEIDRVLKSEPVRWLYIGKDHLQQGLMALTRSVAQPTFF